MYPISTEVATLTGIEITRTRTKRAFDCSQQVKCGLILQANNKWNQMDDGAGPDPFGGTSQAPDTASFGPPQGSTLIDAALR